jgi:hypothetical protein
MPLSCQIAGSPISNQLGPGDGFGLADWFINMKDDDGKVCMGHDARTADFATLSLVKINQATYILPALVCAQWRTSQWLMWR